MVVGDSILMFMTLLAPGSWLVSYTRNYFPPIEWALHPISQLLVPLTYQCHLLNLYGYLAMLVIVLVHGCCSWVELFNYSLLLTPCLVFCGTIEARLQEWGFQVISESYVLRVWCLQQKWPTLNLWEATKAYVDNLHYSGSHLGYGDYVKWDFSYLVHNIINFK